MRHRRVRAGVWYLYVPTLLDQTDQPFGKPKLGDLVRVVKLQGCPPPNTMGHAHIYSMAGAFAGLVCTNSLQPVKFRKDGTHYIADREARATFERLLAEKRNATTE